MNHRKEQEIRRHWNARPDHDLLIELKVDMENLKEWAQEHKEQHKFNITAILAVAALFIALVAIFWK